MSRAYYMAAYYVSWVAFAVFGLLLNLFCLPLLLLPRRERLGRFVRAVIRRLFDFWVRWFHASKVVRITWVGFEQPLQEGVVYVANHPTLVDATILMARLPNAICIFKKALMRNPAIGPAAIMARYVSSGSAVEMVRSVSDSVAAGQAFLIFPEGTRTTPGAVMEPLKPGFALVAQHARAPIQLILIRSSEGLVPRGRAWWRPPTQLPGWLEIRLDQRWDYDPSRSTHDLAALVEKRMRGELSKVARSG